MPSALAPVFSRNLARTQEGELRFLLFGLFYFEVTSFGYCEMSFLWMCAIHFPHFIIIFIKWCLEVTVFLSLTRHNEWVCLMLLL